jgi:excisionase family DNA binding protein
MANAINRTEQQYEQDEEVTRLLSQATITVEEAARLLGISRPTAYAAARTGELPTLRFGRRRLVPVARLRAMLGADAA